MSKTNLEYICKNYTLPLWFNHKDIDWVRYYPTKDEKIYTYNTKRTIEKNIREEKKVHNIYIYDDEKVKIYNIFTTYLAYINNMYSGSDITMEEMKILLSIKICDYDWIFMWSEPEHDKNSEELLLQKNKIIDF